MAKKKTTKPKKARRAAIAHSFPPAGTTLVWRYRRGGTQGDDRRTGRPCRPARRARVTIPKVHARPGCRDQRKDEVRGSDGDVDREVQDGDHDGNMNDPATDTQQAGDEADTGRPWYAALNMRTQRFAATRVMDWRTSVRRLRAGAPDALRWAQIMPDEELIARQRLMGSYAAFLEADGHPAARVLQHYLRALRAEQRQRPHLRGLAGEEWTPMGELVEPPSHRTNARRQKAWRALSRELSGLVGSPAPERMSTALEGIAQDRKQPDELRGVARSALALSDGRPALLSRAESNAAIEASCLRGLLRRTPDDDGQHHPQVV